VVDLQVAFVGNGIVDINFVDVKNRSNAKTA